MKFPKSNKNIFSRNSKAEPTDDSSRKKNSIFVDKPLFKKAKAKRISDVPFVNAPLFRKRKPEQGQTLKSNLTPKAKPIPRTGIISYSQYCSEIDKLVNSRRYKNYTDEKRLLAERELDVKLLPRTELRDGETQEARDNKIAGCREIIGNIKRKPSKPKKAKSDTGFFARLEKNFKSTFKAKESKPSQIMTTKKVASKKAIPKTRPDRLAEIYEEVYGISRSYFMED